MLAVALAVTGAGALWLRDSPLFAVEQVSVIGPSSPDAKRIKALLAGAAREQSTLQVDAQALMDAVAGHAVVAGVRTHADLPHDLVIEVLERDPVAALEVADRRIPVTADGTLLEGTPPEHGLPTIAASRAPAEGRVTDASTRRALRLIARAPEPLRRRSRAVTRDRRTGYVVALRDGPRIVFGAPADLAAKWVAAARVLADERAAGATYVDVRIPGRPAAGGFPTAPEPEGSTPGSESAMSQPGVEVLPPATSVAAVP